MRIPQKLGASPTNRTHHGRVGGQTLLTKLQGAHMLLLDHPDDWQERLRSLEDIDWRKANPQWDGVCIVAGSVSWAEIVRETKRLNLTQSDSALAEAKLKEASETLKTRMKEAWCYLIYPVQTSAQCDIEWMSSKVPAQDGLLERRPT